MCSRLSRKARAITCSTRLGSGDMRVFGVISPEILPFCHFGAWGEASTEEGGGVPNRGGIGRGSRGRGRANQRGAEFAPKLQGLPGCLPPGSNETIMHLWSYRKRDGCERSSERMATGRPYWCTAGRRNGGAVCAGAAEWIRQLRRSGLHHAERNRATRVDLGRGGVGVRNQERSRELAPADVDFTHG